MWKSNVGRPTPSARCYLREWVCSMAWRFHAIDAMLSTELRLLDGVEVHEGLTSRRESRVASIHVIHTQVLQDKDQQIDINRKKAVDVMRACFKPILPDQGAKLLHRVQNLPPPSVSRNPKCIDLDDLLELTHNTWATTSRNWRTHLEFLLSLIHI